MELTTSQDILVRGLQKIQGIVERKNTLPILSHFLLTAQADATIIHATDLELGSKGVRVNILHPHAVMDTGIWTPEVLESRAKHYKMSVDEYKKSNLLKVEITSKDVAELVCTMVGPVFSKTTGAQVPIDGGNDRVI